MKQMYEFLLTGVSVVFLYAIYFISAFIATFIAWIPISLAIKFVSNITDIMYNAFMG